MFLVGLELEPEKFRKNLSKSVAVSVAGILLPFGAGVGVSKLLYENYGSPAGSFTSYFIFLGLAMSITSIPVLARILASRKLLSTSVGQTTLAAAATDDAIAWCMLIFVIALINFPSESWKAVVIFVIVVVYGLFLWFAVKPAFKYLFAKSGKKGATSQSNVAIVFMALCISAWFTQAIGVHAIFGSFLIGSII
jgi:Kef-type K+ transport system membrane component KefB